MKQMKLSALVLSPVLFAATVAIPASAAEIKLPANDSAVADDFLPADVESGVAILSEENHTFRRSRGFGRRGFSGRRFSRGRFSRGRFLRGRSFNRGFRGRSFRSRGFRSNRFFRSKRRFNRSFRGGFGSRYYRGYYGY